MIRVRWTAILLSVLLFSCAPVLNREMMREGDRDVSFSALRKDPVGFTGRLYIFGGVIVETRLTGTGSRIEAMQVPVDRYGHFQDRGMSEGRFLAVTPLDEGLLDPEVFKKGRRITIAAEFTELYKGKIDEMEYTYPVFRIRQIHLWPRESEYYPAAYYDPWFYPYPYFYRGPWWSSPFYYSPYYYGGYGGFYGYDYYDRYYRYGGTWQGPHRPPRNVVPPQAPGPYQRFDRTPRSTPAPAPAQPQGPPALERGR